MDKSGGSSRSARHARNKKERDRRMNMKVLLDTLASVIHPQPPKLSVPVLVDHATSYVNQLHERIETLKQQKENLKSSRLPVLDIKHWDSMLEVNLVCGTNKNFMLHEIIRVLQEEGAEVTSFTQQTVGDTTFYTIKSQAIIPRVGIEASMIHERLKQLIY